MRKIEYPARTVKAAIAALLLLPAVAGAEARHVLRLATVAPDGTAWARELKAFSREVEIITQGDVKVKWVLGGIAGSEVEVDERIRRGQLDGTASGGMLCQKMAPSMRVMRIRGVFNTRDEAAHVMQRIAPQLEEEAARSGYVLLGTTGLGPDVVFSRHPITGLEDLRRYRLWRWDLDDIAMSLDEALNMKYVPMSLEQAGQAYDDGKIDGFIAIPTAALAFQWFTRARYLIDLRMGYLWGCLIVARRSFDKLPFEHQQTIRSATAKLVKRFEDIGRQQDDALLNGLFEKQGLKPLPVSDTLRAQFLAAAREAREKLGEKLVARPLLEKVLAILADYRAEHHR